VLLWQILAVVASVAGFVYPEALLFTLFYVLFLSPTLYDVIHAVTHPARALLLTGVLLVFTIYGFAVIGLSALGAPHFDPMIGQVAYAAGNHTTSTLNVFAGLVRWLSLGEGCVVVGSGCVWGGGCLSDST
jgi:hypothetical protein